MTARRGSRIILAKNPIGRVPLIEFEDGRLLAESNAMLLHFAEGTRYLPSDKFDRAKAYEWLFFEQYSHEPAIAVRISIMTAPERAHMRTPERLAQLLESGNHALGVMETAAGGGGLAGGRRYSIADMALYAYTHRAELGGYDLSTYPGRQRLACARRVAAGPCADRVAAVASDAA